MIWQKLGLQKFLHWYYLWCIGLLMVVFGKIYESYYSLFDHDRGHQYVQKIQKQIGEIESVHSKLVQDLQKLSWDDQPASMLSEKIASVVNRNKTFQKFQLLFCKDGTLLYWTQAETYFDPNWCPCSESYGKGIFEISNQYYFGTQSKIGQDSNGICVTSYLPVVQPETSSGLNLKITDEKTEPNQLALKDSKQKTIAYVSHLGKGLSRSFSEVIILFYLALLLVIYYPVHFFSKLYFTKKNYPWAFLSLSTGIILTSSLANWLVQDPDYFDSIFTLTRIKSVWFEYTLFELIVFSFLFFHISYLFHRYFSLPDWTIHSRKLDKLIVPGLNYLTIFIALMVYCSVFKTVFVKSKIVFDLHKTIFMSSENYLILLALLLFLISVFLICHKLFQSTFSFQIPFKSRFFVFTAAAFLFIPILHYSKLDIHPVTFLLGASIIIWLMDYFVEYKQASSMWLISWLLIISFVTSGLISHYQNIRKRYLKSEMISSLNLNSTQDSSGQFKELSDINQLIGLAIKENFELFVFESGSLQYSSGFNSPEFKQIEALLKKENEKTISFAHQESYIRKVSPELFVILRHPSPSIIETISLFSYLFTLLIILSYLISLFNQRHPILPEGLHIQVESKPSLRTKIQFYIILGIVFSFLIIALVTVFFTKRSEQQISEESMSNKLLYLSTFLEQSIKSTTNTADAQFVLIEKIKNTYNLFDYRPEFYNNQGFEVAIQTNPGYDQKIKLCNPEFYFYYPFSLSDIIIKRNRLPDGREKLSAFKNIFYNNARLGTLELSSFQEFDQSTDNRLTNLINTLLNIYVFLFLIAASLATLLANSITSPLEVLSEKIKSMRLGKRNDTLDWAGQDEIGDLIHDYNRMVSQLDESASMLAKSERDSAWREMAKQVAHEIKNPLTPMKLNIQYLLQKIKSGEEHVGEMAQRVSHTILEQIDGLTQIATEFSNFAKMPQGVHEKVLLNEVISNVHDLYRKREDLEIFLTIPIDEFYCFCDRNQIIRVLNNLINNAIQAIPDHRKGIIQIRLFQQKNNAIISIKDNGIGIEEHMREKVFLPNFTTKSSGTGLGLAMCRQIIESVNGSIDFNTEVQVGTEFIVELPLMKENPPEQIL